MTKQITVDFAEDGSIKIEGHGFRGVECDAAMSALEKALGVQTSRQNKPEYRQASGQQVSQTQKN